MRESKKNLLILRALLFTFFFVFSHHLNAQTRSRITGEVMDSQSGEPIMAATVMIKGTSLGTATDKNGKFFIINVPVGKYSVQVSIVGYKTKTLTDVIVSANQITKLEVDLQQSMVSGDEVVTTAKRDQIHKEVSNTQLVVTSDQIENTSGIREINSFLSKLPGVSESNGFLTIRGGSADQTGSLVNGLSYMNAAVGNAETVIPLSAVDQVSLMSGGFNAEYGNFRSGLVNITTKSGNKDKYTGTFSFSGNSPHLKRFGQSFYDAHNDYLMPFLDADVAFIGTAKAWKDDPYTAQQHMTFDGWIAQANNFNIGKPVERQAKPLDYYLLACWMFMTEPDYEGLARQGLSVPDEQKTLFAQHRMKEIGQDWNFDGGFGGPVPLVSDLLGDATFYLSNKSSEKYYVMPFQVRSEKTYTTLGTLKMQPVRDLTINYNILWKRQIGLSPIRAASGDSPNAGKSGGFMPVNNIKYVADNAGYWFDPPFFPILNQTTLINGLTLNYVFNQRNFAELTVSYLNIYDHSPNGDNRDTNVVTWFGVFPVNEMPYGKLQFRSPRIGGFSYPSYDALPGIGERFRGKEGDLYDNSNIKQIQSKFDFTSQFDDNNYFKAGVEYNYVDIFQNIWQKWNQNAYNVYEFNYHRYPSQLGIYTQDQITYEGIIANIGLRADYYYGGGGTWPSGDPFNEAMFRPQIVDTSLFSILESGRSNIWEIWEKYDAEHPGFLEPIKNYWTFSPRIGISFPVTAESKFYFNYGHFRSNPPYYTMFMYRYRYDKNGLYNMSNPNLEPPRTISYELGVAYNFYQNYLLSISGYSKDVTGQPDNVRYQNSKGTVIYDNLANNAYNDIRGFEVNIAKNDNSWLTGWVNFNYMLKKEGLTGRSTITDITINNDQEGLYAGQETKLLPQPKINANITFRTPTDWGPDFLGYGVFGNWYLTLFGEWQKGGYFTWNPTSKPHINQNMNWPDYFMIDLKISKAFKIFGTKATCYIDVSNLFNIKVNQLSKNWAFANDNDMINYIASLHLPMYDSPDFDNLRTNYPGYYIPGNDKVGDMRSEDKPYINDPNNSFFLYGSPRDIWFGIKLDF